MALPQAVQAQAARSEALAQKLKSGQTITVEDIGKPINAPTNADLRTQPAAPAAAAPPPPAAPAAPAATPPQPPVDEASWEHKFKVLQGKYNAEVPRLHEQNRTLSGEIQGIKAQLASTQSLLTTLGQQQAASAVIPVSPTGLVKDEEVKAFGADLYDFIQRTAKEAILPQVGQMVSQQVAPMTQQVLQQGAAVQQVAQQQAKTAEELTYTELDRLVPDWEQVNGSAEFGNWLYEQDPYSGARRGDMLAQAFKNGDAPRVAQFFTGFRKENAVVSPGSSTPPAALAATPAVSLASLAAPGIGNGGPPTGAPNEADRRIYTAADIAAFYRARQTGQFRGKEAEAAAMERDIFKAQKEGRVRAR